MKRKLFDFFDSVNRDDENADARKNSNTSVPGLVLIENLLTKDEEKTLLSLFAIDSQEWSSELKRRVIHYGFKYDYKSRQAACAAPLIPPACAFIEKRLNNHNVALLPKEFDQLIVNEYLPGQGISAHVDSDVFTDGIVSVSLGSGATMRFSHPTTKESVDIWLPRRSAVILTGDARYKWRHAISASKQDKGHGARKRRVSLTFRKMK